MKKLLFICFTVMVYSFAVNASPKSNSNSTFYCPSPVINSFSPSQGPVNTQVTLVGSNFENTASVNIDGVSTSFTIVSNNELLVTIPEGAESSTITVLTTGACSGTSANSFTVLEDSCSIGEVYISEVYDSETGSYGAVELYNPTNTVINLNGVYELQRFGDIGDATPSAIIPLTGTIAPQSTYMIVMGSTGNTCSGFPIGDAVAAGINDNDEIKLVKNSTVIDVVEAIDERGYTIIRNANATAPLDTYNVSDWSISTFEDCSNLNTHTDTANNTIPEITDPISQTICENGMITFSTSLNNSIFQYQWKVLDTSGNWVDVPNSSPYSNPQNSWLDITNVPLSFNGNQYYCEVTYNSCTLITNAAQITIDTPEVDTLPDVEVCTEYTLPTLTNGNYYTATNGSGTQLNAGDNITTNQTIYIYNEVGTAPNTCSNESSFEVTIIGTPDIDTLSDVEVCTEYTLPTLTNGNYYTATNGTGTLLNAGDNITTNQTIYIYNEVGTAPNTCSNESSFEVTITGTPNVDSLPDVEVCTEFTLPTLTNGNYYTATNGTGTLLNAGDNITTNQTIYIYNEVGSAPNTCSNESSFEITIYPANDFSLDSTNIIIDANNITIVMDDSSINYEFAIDNSNFQTSTIFNNLSEGFHTLFVQDANGCVIKSLQFLIQASLHIPKFFTPNSDGFNDTWMVYDPNNSVKEIFIFNRYGKLLKQLSPNSYGWDGTYNGNNLESNDYWYLITLHNNQELRGHFTLKR